MSERSWWLCKPDKNHAHDFDLIDEAEEVIANLFMHGRGDRDARLIAAAPELMAACQAVLAQLDYLRGLWGDEGVTRRLADQVRAAVKKGGGE